MEERLDKSSSKTLWTTVTIVGICFIVIGVMLVLLVQSNVVPRSGKTAGTSTSSTNTTVTQEDVRQSIETTSSNLKQASSDQEAAQATIDDSKNQVKVGS